MKKCLVITTGFVALGFSLLFALQQNDGKGDKDFLRTRIEQLGVKVIGPADQREIVFPDSFQDAQWGYINRFCEEGGYHLSDHAGNKVVMVSFLIDQLYENEPLYVHAVMYRDNIVCVYKSVGHNSVLAPGIFSIKHGQGIRTRSGK